MIFKLKIYYLMFCCSFIWSVFHFWSYQFSLGNIYPMFVSRGGGGAFEGLLQPSTREHAADVYVQMKANGTWGNISHLLYVIYHICPKHQLFVGLTPALMVFVLYWSKITKWNSDYLEMLQHSLFVLTIFQTSPCPFGDSFRLSLVLIQNIFAFLLCG